MKRAALPKSIQTLAYLVIGVAFLGALNWLRIWTQPLWDRDAFHWTYTETTTPAGRRLSLSIKAKSSDMTSMTHQSFTPTLAIICEQQHVYVEMETTYPLCVGPCGPVGIYSTFEYFVTDPGLATQDRQRDEWHVTNSAPTRAEHFYEASEDLVFAEKDAPRAVAFVHRLAAAKEYGIDLGSGRSEFVTADFADQLKRLQQACPSLR